MQHGTICTLLLVSCVSAFSSTITPVATITRHHPVLRSPPPPLLMTAAPHRHEPGFIEWASNTATSNAIAPAITLFAFHAALRTLLRRLGIGFPASVVGMLGVFAIMCVADAWRPSVAARTVKFFDPACAMFRTWLAAIFAPGFIGLPLSMPPVRPSDLLAFVSLVTIGVASSTATNAAVANVLTPANCRFDANAEECATTAATPAAITPAAAPTATARSTNPAFPRVQQAALGACTLGFGGLYLLGGSAVPLTLCLLAATLGSFSLASTLCSPTVQLWLHPFLACSLLTLLVISTLGSLSGNGARLILHAYASAVSPT